jgi:hypothetical protein
LVTSTEDVAGSGLADAGGAVLSLVSTEDVDVDTTVGALEPVATVRDDVLWQLTAATPMATTNATRVATPARPVSRTRAMVRKRRALSLVTAGPSCAKALPYAAPP